MSPRKRNKINKPLPERWRYKHGAYYYRVPESLRDNWDGKSEFRLGATLQEAYKTWSERLNTDSCTAHTFGEVIDRYIYEIIPTKAESTQDSNLRSIRKLRPVFGDMPLVNSKGECSIKPKHAYQYFDVASKKGRTTAKHDVQVLRHVITKAVEWGLLDANPLLNKQVQLTGFAPRDRLVEDWEIAEALSLEDNARGVVVCKKYVCFKLMTGLRRTDILRIELPWIKEDGIHIQPSKTAKTTGKRLIIQWDEEGELEALVQEILAMPPRRIGNATLFTTRQGKPFNKNAFDSIWQRYMDKVLNKTKVFDRFQERDLRAKTATESDTLLEASERLAHASTSTTNRIYRRKPNKVKPLILDVTKRTPS